MPVFRIFVFVFAMAIVNASRILYVLHFLSLILVCFCGAARTEQPLTVLAADRDSYPERGSSAPQYGKGRKLALSGYSTEAPKNILFSKNPEIDMKVFLFQSDMDPPKAPPRGNEKLTIENMGLLYKYSTDNPKEPVHVFHTDQPNLLVGTRVVSFSEDGRVTGKTVLDTTSNAVVTAVDSLADSAEKAIYVAIAQDAADGTGSVISVYSVSPKNSYSLFSRIQTSSSVSAMEMYFHPDGAIMLALAQRSSHCTADWDLECGLSLIYRICGISGEAELGSVVQTGNASSVRTAPGERIESVSLLYSGCEINTKGEERCQIINQYERPEAMPDMYYADFSCDPSGAELFEVNRKAFYVGPSQNCKRHQISSWNEKMGFAHALNVFEDVPDHWFVVSAPNKYCDAALILAGAGKKGTTFYGLQSPARPYSTLLRSPTISVAQMWTLNGNIFCIDKSAGALSLYKITCLTSEEIPPTDSPDHTLPYWESLWATSTAAISETLNTAGSPVTNVGSTSSTQTSPTSTGSSVHHGQDDISGPPATVVKEASGTTDAPAEEVESHFSTTLSSGFVGVVTDQSSLWDTTPASDHVDDGYFPPDHDQNAPTECHISVVPQKIPLRLYSPFSSIVHVQAGSVLVVPPVPTDPCYNVLQFGSHKEFGGVMPTSRSAFCDQASQNINASRLHQSKSTSQSGPGNIYIVSSYGNILEFASVIKNSIVFDIKRAKANVNFSSIAIRVCEGFPTACAVVQTCRKSPSDFETISCLADIRCYRMHKLTWEPVVFINASLDTVISMEAYLRSDECMLITEDHHEKQNVLRFYKIKSSIKHLELAEPLEVRTCSAQRVHTASAQRSIWLTAAVLDAEQQCSNTVFELTVDPDQLEERAKPEVGETTIAASGNSRCCDGELLISQKRSGDFDFMIYLIKKGSHETHPVPVVLPRIGAGTADFLAVNDRQYILLRNSTVGMVYEYRCALADPLVSSLP